MRKVVWKTLRYGLIVAWIATMLWQTNKPLPDGINVAAASIAMPQEQIQFLYDLTARDAWGRRVVEQRIFDSIRSILGGHRR